MNKIFNYNMFFVILCNISFLFSFSESRLISTWDMPSEYSLTIDYVNNSETVIDSENDYDVKGGASFSYEHAILQKPKFNLYLGSEIMAGKKSDITLAFHSLYLMPTVNLNEKTGLLFRIGYSVLNTDDAYMPENAFMFSVGSEVKISDDWAFNFSNTWYQSDNRKNFFEICSTPNICYDEPLFVEMKYNKFAVSLVYEISKKETSSSSKRSRGRKR